MAITTFELSKLSIASIAQSRAPQKQKDFIAAILEARASDLLEVRKVTGFDEKNFSSMLSRAGWDVEDGINTLVYNKESLGIITKVEETFEAASLSSMLSGAGGYLGEGIDALVKQPEDGTLRGIDKLKELLDFQIKTRKDIWVNLFDAKSLSSMLNGAGRYLGKGIDALAANKEALGSIVREGVFDSKSLSSMLHGAGRYLGQGINALAANRERLAAIVREGIFDSKSLSSMLDGAGRYLGEGIDALLKEPEDGTPSGIDKLREILAFRIEGAGGIRINLFDSKSLSSMLDRSGRYLGEGINALAISKEKLAAIIQEGIFDSKNISSMLNGAGKDIGIGIEAIESRVDQLRNMCERGRFEPSQIATWLAKIPVSKMGAAIDTMYASYLAKIEGSTDVASGSGAAIARKSRAAQQERQVT